MVRHVVLVRGLELSLGRLGASTALACVPGRLYLDQGRGGVDDPQYAVDVLRHGSPSADLVRACSRVGTPRRYRADLPLQGGRIAIVVPDVGARAPVEVGGAVPCLIVTVKELPGFPRSSTVIVFC